MRFKDTTSGCATALLGVWVALSCPQARADDASDIADQMQDLQNDIEMHQSAAETWDEEVEKVGDTSNCNGPSAAICVGISQLGAAKARSNAQKERDAIRDDQAKIRRLQQKLNELGTQQPPQ
jgi:hypothetical protein